MLTYDAYTDIGERGCNEDSVFYGENKNGELLFAVADGLGGHGGGDVASELVVKQLAQSFRSGELDIAAALSQINSDILTIQQEQSIKCKSTAALIWMNAENVTAATVGDTRIYAFRGGEIIFQSVDHSGAQLAVSVGEITPEQIRGHEDRSILTRALGASESVKADIREIDPDFEALLICSDGFWECITEDKMLLALSGSVTASEWLTRMIDYVNAAVVAEKDNNSAIAIKRCANNSGKDNAI